MVAAENPEEIIERRAAAIALAVDRVGALARDDPLLPIDEAAAGVEPEILHEPRAGLLGAAIIVVDLVLAEAVSVAVHPRAAVQIDRHRDELARGFGRGAAQRRL